MAKNKKVTNESKLSILEILLYIVGIGLITFSVIYGGMKWKEAKNQNDKMEELRDLIAPVAEAPIQDVVETETEEIEVEPSYISPYAEVFKLKNDVYGWLLIPDTRIDYPVMQTKEDEMFYLHHDFYGNEDRTGTLFFAAGVDADEGQEKSDNILIYGHNMRSGAMFGDLDLYKKIEYRDEHPYIYLYLKDCEYVYEIICAGQHKALGPKDKGWRYYSFYNAETQSDWDLYCERMSEKNIYGNTITATDGDQLITLSTCSSNGKMNRFVIVGKRIDPSEIR